MNERIKELLVEAGMQFRLGDIPTHIVSDGTHTFNEFYVYDKFDPEKFAELIVRECASIAKQTDDDDGDDYKSGRQWAGIEILKHFNVGVEE